mgnify:CR=1 FL=1
MANARSVFISGLWNDNPIFRLLIGLCPTLAVTTTAVYGASMGLATTFVLICSSALISIIKKLIPSKVRIPSFIIVIATFVTIVDLMMNAYVPDIHRSLGLFIPLIVVNCLVLGRAEAYASKMPVGYSILDAIGMGLGFTWALMVLGGIRELLGTGELFGFRLLGDFFTPWGIMTSPPGAFITLGLLVAVVNVISARLKKTT